METMINKQRIIRTFQIHETDEEPHNRFALLILGNLATSLPVAISNDQRYVL